MKYYLLLSLFFVNISIAQENVYEILSHSEDFYNDKSFTLNISYEMYGSHESKTIIEKYNGTYYRNFFKMYFKIHNTETISFPNEKKVAKIYSDQKIIELYPIKENTVQEPVSIFKYLKYFPEKKVEKKVDVFKITLTASNITQLPFGKVELYIDAKNYHLKKQVLYYLTAIKYKNQKGSEVTGNPRLETKFSNYNPGTNNSLDKKTSFNIFFKSSNQLSKLYSDYKLINY